MHETFRNVNEFLRSHSRGDFLTAKITKNAEEKIIPSLKLGFCAIFVFFAVNSYFSCGLRAGLSAPFRGYKTVTGKSIARKVRFAIFLNMILTLKIGLSVSFGLVILALL